ncbi:MAG: zf-HC2 domain-containing protein [Acidobacteria bacterium]|nr:zf-HC2 domain-containing protein [Acidobacteriota bacterium]
MNRLCKLFDRFQDGELNPEEQEKFRQHLTVCDSCRTRNYLLVNVARAIKIREIPEPHRDPEKISAIAFERSDSWDALSFYWPKPATAWIAFAAILLVFSFLQVQPSGQEAGINVEYEMLMTDSDLNNTNQNILIAPTDDEIVRWLEEGGEIQ